MTRRKASLLGGAVLALGTLSASTSMPQSRNNEFFIYPTYCVASVVGEIHAWADVQGYDFFVYDENTTDLSQRFDILSGDGLRFTGSGSAGVGVSGDSHYGCRVHAEAANRGTLTYGFRGDTSSMAVSFESSRKHAHLIERGDGREHTVVLAESSWGMPGYDKVEMQVPFLVGGGDDGVIVIDSFAVRRADSGPTYGNTAATWTIYENTNGDCDIDRGEPVLNSGSLVAYPNSSVSADPIRFRAPRGNYILVVTYDTLSYLATYSTECGQAIRESATVDDAVALELSLH